MEAIHFHVAFTASASASASVSLDIQFSKRFSAPTTYVLRATVIYKQPSSLLIDKDLKTWKSYGSYPPKTKNTQTNVRINTTTGIAYYTTIFFHVSLFHTQTSINKTATMSTQSYKDATSKVDLVDILSDCSHCYDSTHEGDFILCHSDLPTIQLKNYKKRPVLNFIVNVLGEENKSLIGHWTNIVVLRQAGRYHHALLCDSLRDVTNNHVVMENVKKFCSNNALQTHCLNARYQDTRSRKCGYLSIGIVAYTHGKSRLSDMTRLQKILQRNSVKTNESLILKMYRKHFMR